MSLPSLPSVVMPVLDTRSAFAFVVGVCVPIFLPELTPLAAIVGMLVLALLLVWRSHRLSAIAAFLIGFAWASAAGMAAVNGRLDAALAGDDIAITGVITGLPRTDLVPPRFDLIADGAGGVNGLVRLSWYGQSPDLRAGQRFTGNVRLRVPRGLDNPGGFDYSRYALEQRLVASGYVRDGAIADAAAFSFAAGVDHLRDRVADHIDTHVEDDAQAALLRALAVGDQRGMQEPEWNVLRVTGTGHLIAISGMHIGLVAAFGAWMFGGLYRLWPRLALWLPRLTFSAAGALLWATAYSLLAGWSLPVQRTLVMIIVVLAARMLQRNISMVHSLALAAVVVLLWDPLAVLGAGFWLSFIGVAGLMWALPDVDRRRSLIGSFGRAQIAMSLGLLPITIAFFGQGSLIGPLANLLAVPWITFLIVPLLLFATLCLGVVPSLGYGVFKLAAWALQPLWRILEWMTDLPGASWYFAEPQVWSLLLAIIGAVWLFLPRGAPMRALGLLLFLPLLMPRSERIAEGDARVSMFDVGQGLSVLVQTRTHALLFDAGARSRTGMDMGEMVVVPSLHALGVDHLDRLVLSNLDADHAGGREAVLRAFPDAAVSIGIDSDPSPRCETGEAWDWDGVRFEFLHPPQYFPDRGNDSSCVLRVEAHRGSALLTGDISALIETRLLREAAEKLRADLVFVPHHGSRSSSSPEFVEATGASLAFNSAGRDNRYGHPHREVQQRWTASGARWIATADGGYASVLLSAPETVQQRRLQRPRYWH